MNLIMILCMIMLASSKVTIQGAYAKKYISSTTDSIYFNGIIFFFSTLLFAYALKTSLYVIGFGIFFGVLTVLFQLCYIRAMSFKNVSITVLIVNLSMIMPILFSAVFFKERFNYLRIAGILTVIVSLSLSVKKPSEKSNRKWILLSISAFILNSCLAICQQIFGKISANNETSSFVAWSYLTATAISFITYIMLHKRNNQSFEFKIPAVIYGLCTGIFLGIFQFINTKAISIIDAGLLFPVYNGGTLILTTISGVFLLKDKLSIRQIISILTGIAGIILINL